MSLKKALYEILERYIRLFTSAVGPDFNLIDDSVRPHRAHIVNEFLKSENIRRMDWSVRCRDLNPLQSMPWILWGRQLQLAILL
ncbi:transposable element Tcb2 transposase [Trichonephila clavipes]|nr:transposable element Tcb2 transposase [Trichonephila clavipes]